MAKIDMTPIESKAIAEHGYDPKTGTMRIKFRSGHSYDHHGVSPERYVAFTGNSSPGAYYHRQIRPHHKYTKVKG